MGKLKDILALTRAGFKAAEIKKMLEEDTEDTEPDQAPEEPESTDEPEPEAPEDPGEDEQDKPEPEPDYKALYADAQKKLKEAQKLNARKPGPEPEHVSDEEYIKKLVEDFY